MNGVFSTESNNPELRETTVSHSMASGVNLKFVIREYFQMAAYKSGELSWVRNIKPRSRKRL